MANDPVPQDDPFQGDTLNRRELIPSLTQIIKTAKDSFVLAIDSGFGTGKTTFITMWKRHLEKNGFRTLLFSAWESDFIENALISMLGEFRIAAANWDPTSSSGTRAAEKVIKALAKHALPIALRYGTMGLLDGGKIVEDIGKAMEELAEERIKEYEKDKATIKQFKAELATFVETFGAGNPVVFL